MNWRLALMREIDRAAMEAKEIIASLPTKPTAMTGEVWMDIHEQQSPEVRMTRHYAPQIFIRTVK